MAPTLLTPRLVLHAWIDDDTEAWADMNADPRVMEFFPSTDLRERSLQSAQVLRSNLDRDGCGWWVVEVKGCMPFAGVIALQPVPFEAPFTPANEIGWRFCADAWGMGYATESALAALKFAFEKLKWPEVVAMTASINLRSRRVMERIGMTHDSRDDFDHPRLESGHRLQRHVLYRAKVGPAE
ncbi:MAG: GNAT family N-acetyltransferase [Candidatus Eremiobacteraeota bacterium]|nr:GNAT family N-acetyltransferase [Candidatus Eremiobacteraeota bacterium]